MTRYGSRERRPCRASGVPIDAADCLTRLGRSRVDAARDAYLQAQEDPMSGDPTADVPIRDMSTTAAKLADLTARTDEAIHAGSAKAVEKQHARGKMTARERIAALVDEVSFVEFVVLALHRSRAFGL